MAEAPPNPSASPANPNAEDLSVSLPESWRPAIEQRTGPARRIALIEESQRCLTCGWLSLVPFTGVFFVLPAVRLFRRVDRERAEWNPAAHLWLRGLVLACFGFWASLLWWGGLAAVIVNPPEEDLPRILLFLLLFGSAPVLFGLGLAAARWPNRFGAFVQRCRRMLFGLWLLAYAVLAQVLVLREAFHLEGPFNASRLSPQILYWLLWAWLIWVPGGFILLAGRRPKLGWWLAWFAGAALLTEWITAK